MEEKESSRRGLPLLNSSNWTYWDKVMYGELLARGNLWGIVAGTEVAPVLPANPTEAEQRAADRFEERKAKALGILLTNIGPEIFAYLPRHPDNPVEVWQTLENRCQPNTFTSFFALRAQLNQMSLKKGEDPLDWLRRRKEVYDRLAGMNHSVEDATQCMETLALLPESYTVFRESLLILLGSQGLNYNQLTDQLRTHLAAKKCTADFAYPIDESANYAYGGRGRGMSRGRGKNFGRGYQNFSQGEPAYGGKSKGPKCYGCNEFGHIKRNCPKKGQNQNSEANKKSDEHAGRVANSEDSKGYDHHLYKVSCASQEKLSHLLLDSGATTHMTSNYEVLSDIIPLSRHESVCLADDKVVYATDVGKLKVQMNDLSGKPGAICTFQRCLYVPQLSATLISVKEIDEVGHLVLFGNGKATISTKDGKFVGKAVVVNNSYVLDCEVIKNKGNRACPSQLVNQSSRNERMTELWHRRYGHLGEKNLEKILKGDLVHGIQGSYEKLSFCQPCVDGKLCEKPFPKKSERVSVEKLELVHSDICGPLEVPTNSGNRYFMTFTDDFSRYVWVYLLKTKGQAFDAFKEWLESVELETEKKVKCFRSDNGTEYMSREFTEFLAARGIRHQLSAPYSPQQNGTAERLNRTLTEKARSMLVDSGLEQRFWGEAVVTAAYLHNRSPTSTLPGKTPFEVWYGQKPYVGNFRVFGCIAYALIPRQHRKKMGKHTEKCIFIGYACNSKAYRLWSLERRVVLVRRSVAFDEKKAFSEPDKIESTVQSKPREITQYRESMLSESESEDECEPISNVEAGLRRTHRQNAGNPPERYGISARKAGLIAEEGVPLNLKEALHLPNSEKWKEATDSEYNSLMKNEVWELVDRPVGRKIVGGKWVFRIKRDEFGNVARYKARFVAQGFSQTYGEDYTQTFSPVVRWESVRVLLSLAVQLGMLVHQLDIETAFLNGILEEDVFMEQPEGYAKAGDENKVCKLKKSIYGLKQSPRAWNFALDEYLKRLQFKQSDADPCIYSGKVNGKLVFMAVYVDDILIISKEKETIANTKKLLQKRFKTKDLGQLHHFLGVRITQANSGIWLGQDRYIKDILLREGMQDAKPISTPMESGLSVEKSQSGEKRVDIKRYQSVVGSLLYLARATRPDIAFAVHKVAQFASDPAERHWFLVKRILRYLKGTSELGLVFLKNENPDVVAYADADFAADPNDRKSTSGYTLMKNGGAICWNSKKQSSVAQSTAEAEYISLFFAVQECVWVRRLLCFLGQAITEPTTVLEDNQAAIILSSNPANHPKTKHIQVKYHFSREAQENKEVIVQYCPTEKMLADIFTKALAKPKLEEFRKSLGVSSEIKKQGEY